MSKKELYQPLESYVGNAISGFNNIPESRKKALEEVAEYIRGKRSRSEKVSLTFICTHNSRRSHLSQVWAQTAAYYYDLDNITCYSGGTEATAFNPRAVAAMERAGFKIENLGGANPHYKLRFNENTNPIISFSKTYDDPYNPQSGFAAIMTCSEADEACPMVSGAEYRMAIPYFDPKVSDNTEKEEATYDARCLQIASEMFYLMSQVPH